MKEVKIIGTSHISGQSVKEIKEYITSEKPEIVAVELDAQRAYALLHEEKRKMPLSAIIQLGVKGYLFAKIGQYVQQKLGSTVGVAPGTEMKTAMELAKEHKLQLALIDQPIQITLKNFSKQITWREKFRFLGDIFKGIFQPKKQAKKLGLDQFDLSKVPSDKLIEKMMGQLQKRYPGVYKSLVGDRNKYMIKKIVKLLRDHPGKKILVVVGAGHKEGMEELLLRVDVV